MDMNNFIERLLDDKEPDLILLADGLKGGLSMMVTPLSDDPKLLLSFLYNNLSSCLSTEDPLTTFLIKKEEVLGGIREVCPEIDISEDFFNLLIQLHESHSSKPKETPVPKSAMKVAPSAKEIENSRYLFKTLYMEAAENNPEFLMNTDMAMNVLDILNSDASTEAIQNDLINILGEFNIEVISRMLTNRDLIKAVVKKSEVKGNSMYQAMPVVSIVQKKPRKKDKRQKKPTSNLEVLKNLGFNDDLVHESYMLGLKEKNVPQPLYEGVSLQHKISKTANLQTVKTKFYTEYIAPAPEPLPLNKEELWPVAALEEWCQPAFAGMSHLNRIQTEVFEKCYFTNDNILVSAPTGAGKTNIALLSVLRVIKNAMDAEKIIVKDFKVVYVAPMKALASEVTAKFTQRLKYLGIQVRELTGDMQLTRTELANTHVIITTPEKIDVVTRKADSMMTQIKLLILDEVHLLDDERGSVLESLVARTIRQVEISQTMIRILALSATLPNYYDVAEFLRVPPEATFFFDSRFRPIPLEQRFLAVKVVPNQVEQMNMILEACYDKVLEQVKADQQVMVFVHSRRDTIQTANALHNLALNRGEVTEFECAYSLSSKKEVDKSRNKDLRELFEWGFGIHNAGMLRKDRNLSEKLFAQKNIKVLVTTATLAWGVNLPAHAVIIKGTEIYDSNIGGFKDVGVLDVQQVFGRAGRPDFDSSGLGIIITTTHKIDKYLDMLVTNKSIESRFASRVKESLNAEISLGTVSNINQAIRWLKYTYFYVRLRKNPLHYGLGVDDAREDFKIYEHVQNMVIRNSKDLRDCRMIKYDENTGSLQSTGLGRTASNFYIMSESIRVYNEKLHPSMEYDDEQFFSMFSESHEFIQLKIREDEEQDLRSLIGMVNETWIKIKKGEESTTYGKVIGLTYAYLTGYPLDTFSLVADMAYVVQNGVRILRALFEICIKRYWGRLAEKMLNLCKMIERRVIPNGNPLRQFGSFTNVGGLTAFSSSDHFMGGYIKDETILRLEQLGLSVDRYEEMPEREKLYWLRNAESVQQANKFFSYLPCVRVDHTVQPITGNIIRLHLKLVPLFEWRERWHGQSQNYWIWVEDTDGYILHFENYILFLSSIQQKRVPEISFAIPVNRQRTGDTYKVICLNDHWIGADFWSALEIDQEALPQESIEYTPLSGMQPIPITALQNETYQSLYKFPCFNPIQSQAFAVLYHSDKNVLLGAPTGSGKTVVSEIAMLRVFSNNPGQKCVYVAPLKALGKERLKDWGERLQRVGKKVVELTGDFTPDMEALNRADILITTPEKWDGITRHWQHREYVQKVGLLIIDEIHLLGQDRGAVLEVIVSRMRYMGEHTSSTVRIIGLSTALSNAHDLAAWLSIEPAGFFNFEPSCRPVPLQAHIDGFPEKAYCPRMATMNRPAYNAIMAHSRNKPTLIFVSSRRQTRITAFDLIAICASEQESSVGFLRIDAQEMAIYVEQAEDANLKQTLTFGIGQHHAGLSENDRKLVEELFVSNRVLVLVATSTLAWGVNFPAHLVVIKGTEFYDPKLKKYVDMPITDILQMMGRAGRPQFDDHGVACIFVQEEKKAFIKTFLYQPFPVESSLAPQLHDHINAEISAGTLTHKEECVQYLNWTYFSRRLVRNPAYYGLVDPSVEGVNEFLALLVDSVLCDLEYHKCIEIDDDGSLRTSNMGDLSAFYYITFRTVSILRDNLTSESSFNTLIELISQLPEFADVPTRHNEESFNEELAGTVPIQVDMNKLDSPYVKTNLLLQAHFSRVKLPISDYLTDTKLVIDQSIRIIHAMVDVCAAVGSLSTALRVMTLSQMICQGQWHYDSSLKNLPGVNPRAFAESRHGIQALCQLVEMPKEQLVFVLNDLRVNDTDKVAGIIDKLPKISLGWKVTESEQEESLWDEDSHFAPGAITNVQVRLEVENNAMAHKPAMAKTGRQQELGFWVMVGCTNSNKVLAVKQIHVPKKKVNMHHLRFEIPENPALMLYLICDSYLGLDQEYVIHNG